MPKFCPNCGTSLKPEWNVCPNCGEKLQQLDSKYILKPQYSTQPQYSAPSQPSATTHYIEETRIPIFIKIPYSFFTCILIISLFLPYLHVSPPSPFYPDGNIYGFFSPLLLIGTLFILLSTIFSYSSKIKATIVLGFIGCVLVFLTILNIYNESIRIHPEFLTFKLGIGFTFGLIAGWGLFGSIIGIVIYVVYKEMKPSIS